MTIKNCLTCGERFIAFDQDDVMCLRCLDLYSPKEEVSEGTGIGIDGLQADDLLVFFLVLAAHATIVGS